MISCRTAPAWFIRSIVASRSDPAQATPVKLSNVTNAKVLFINVTLFLRLSTVSTKWILGAPGDFGWGHRPAPA
jgi:hypothetical protein